MIVKRENHIRIKRLKLLDDERIYLEMSKLSVNKTKEGVKELRVERVCMCVWKLKGGE